MSVSGKILLPWKKPPLSANQRMHWAQRARVVREVRQAACLLARSARLAPQDSITVRVGYRPRDRRRRDPSNLMPTQKAVVDGLVDAGVVPDDCPPYVVELMPEIVEPVAGKGACMWVEIIV